MRIQVIDNRSYDCTPEQLPRDVTDNHDLRKRGWHRHGGYKVILMKCVSGMGQ
jgi:hypothetical protein